MIADFYEKCFRLRPGDTILVPQLKGEHVVKSFDEHALVTTSMWTLRPSPGVFRLIRSDILSIRDCEETIGLLLLRRPLRVGDQLKRHGRLNDAPPFDFSIEDGLTPGFADQAIARGYTHADGTPIGKWTAESVHVACGAGRGVYEEVIDLVETKR